MDSTKLTKNTIVEQANKNSDPSDERKLSVKSDASATGETGCSDPTRLPKKITHFFPILRTNLKAKMGSVIRKKECPTVPQPTKLHTLPVDLLTAASNSAATTTRSVATGNKTEMQKGSASKKTLIHLPSRKTSDILSSALNICISEVLRKNIEAKSQREAEKNKQISTVPKDSSTPRVAIISVEKSKISSLNHSSNLLPQASRANHAQAVQNILDEKNTADKSELTPAVKSNNRSTNSLDINDKQVKLNFLQSPATALTSTLISKSPLPLSPAELPTADTLKSDIETNVPQINNEVNENINSTETSLITTNRDVLSANDMLIQQQGDKMFKNKKGKKRHFKGATYRLYLTPARKKKRFNMKQSNDSIAKDDEMSLTSTENGSCVDSSDACSMFSDDFNTSEKSLADDEPYSNSRSSPLLVLTDQKIDSPDFRVESSVDNNVDPKQNTSLIMDSSNVSMKGESNNSIIDPADNKITGMSAKPSFLSIVSNDRDSVNVPEIITIAAFAHGQTECDKSVINTAPISKTDQTTAIISTGKSASNFHEVCHSAENYTSQVDSSSKDATECNNMIDTNSLPTYAFSGKNKEKKYSISNGTKDGDSSKAIPLSTIATSVKSRQRIKRRFTDDIIDTDVGILSLNSMHASCRKAKVDLLPPPQTKDIIENFDVSINSIAREGPLAKVESVFSNKQQPVDICSCLGATYEVKMGNAPTNFYCQAVDSYGDKLVGCSTAVYTFRLVRASVRTPFTVMCEMHLWRLKQHHCCPRCGVFCSQGEFVKCTAEKGHLRTVHLFHERCRKGAEEKKNDFCLHCGLDSDLQTIFLECDMISPPAFFQSQYSMVFPTKAKISLTAYKGENDTSTDSDSKNSFKLGRTDIVLSPDGLSSEEDSTYLENLLSTFNANEIEEINNPITELYYAARDGDERRVLRMLAKGTNPNEIFPAYDNNTALHVACTSGNVIISHLLLQSGAVADTLNRNLRTPLMLATENNSEKVAELLVKRKAPINTKGEVGMTCLHIASRDGQINLCSLFLDSGRAQVNAQDDGGWTPIVWASEHGHEAIVKILINRGGDPNIRDNEGNTALHWAAFCGTTAVCVMLLNYGCNINEANEHGDTPLHIAARQDNYNCVDLFLSRAACLDMVNRSNELPVDCCNSSCRSAKALTVSLLLKEVFKDCNRHRSELILSSDIALGREKYPIRCVNSVDDMDLNSSEFLYVTENCETCPIKIDRSITSLQRCSCSEDCTLSSCTCSAISFKCWYDTDGRLLPEFNMLDPPLLFECNRACSCDVGICRNRVVQRGMSCRLELMRTDGRGWGVRAMKNIPKGTFICEYVGELITDSEADTRQDDSYLFDLDNKDGETYCLDARHFGNISRFINHLCEPNLVPVKVFIDHQDLSFPRIAFFSLRDIGQYEELGFDYGEKFWVIKSKSFTCNCGSGKCKYSKETIKETLESYNSRMREDGLDEIDIIST